MTMKHNRCVSTCVYMSIIAVNDNLFLLLALHAWYNMHMDPWHFTKWLCKIKTYIVHASGTFGAYEIAFMTLDKFIAIKFPHKTKLLCTAKRAKILSFANFVFVSLYYLPNIYLSNLIENTTHCARYVKEEWYVTAYTYLSFILNPLLPVISLFAMNFIILRVVLGRKKIRTAKASNNSERQITIMLILVSVTFLVLLLPFEVRTIYYSFKGQPDNPKAFAVHNFLFILTIDLFGVNYGINFFLYLLAGTKFRRDFVSLIYKRKRQTNFSDLGTSSDQVRPGIAAANEIEEASKHTCTTFEKF